MNIMSDDAKAIVLLCGRLGKQSAVEPLRQREYTGLTRWLVSKKMRPADLLKQDDLSLVAMGSGINEQRLSALLKRGVQLGFAIEKWNSSNIWVICRSDAEYPKCYKTHLKDSSPPILFCVGNKALLNNGGIAIVGSRNVDEVGDEYTRNISRICASSSMTVISGGARGVDQIAMQTALAAGGSVVGVLVDNLLKKSVTKDARKAIADGRLLLITPYHPEARFTVGTAMGRNKLIYALADYALVISADHKKGGTWEGAKEELKRSHSRPVLVRMSGNVPLGNKKLLELGALECPDLFASDDPELILQNASKRKPSSIENNNDLFSYAETHHSQQMAVCEPAATEPKMDTQTNDKQKAIPAHSAIYHAVLPVIIDALNRHRGIDELAKELNIAKGQLQTWLKLAVAENKIKKSKKPVQYKRS